VSGRWLQAWSAVIVGLSSNVDLWELTRRDLVGELRADPLRRRRLASDLEGASWAHLYELSPRKFLWRCSRQLLTLPQMAGVGFLVFDFFRSPAKHRVRDISAGDDPPLSRLPHVMSAFRAWDANARAYLLYQRSMIDLIAAGRQGDDSALILAARIDPAAILAPTFQKRVYMAVAMDDRDFITRVSTALREPVRDELQNARLQSALLLMAKARQLHKLNEDLAAELFIKRTRLYPSKGRKDARRSLWRFIQRWKKEHATQIRE